MALDVHFSSTKIYAVEFHNLLLNIKDELGKFTPNVLRPVLKTLVDKIEGSVSVFFAQALNVARAKLGEQPYIELMALLNFSF